MILGVDHIALSCGDVGRAVAVLERNGFTPKFVEKDVPNPAAKAGLLNSYGPVHSVAYCRSEGSIAIELTQHSPVPSGAGAPYRVVFSSPLSDSVPAGRVALSGLADVFGPATDSVWFPFAAPYSALGGGERPAVRGVCLPVAHLERAETFWSKGLGAKAVRRGEGALGRWSLLRFHSPVRSWTLDLALTEVAASPAKANLDSPGFSCVALLTNRLARDLAQALDAGGSEASAPISLSLGAQELEIAFFRGPDGELIELVRVSLGSES